MKGKVIKSAASRDKCLELRVAAAAIIYVYLVYIRTSIVDLSEDRESEPCTKSNNCL